MREGRAGPANDLVAQLPATWFSHGTSASRPAGAAGMRRRSVREHGWPGIRTPGGVGSESTESAFATRAFSSVLVRAAKPPHRRAPDRPTSRKIAPVRPILKTRSPTPQFSAPNGWYTRQESNL